MSAPTLPNNPAKGQIGIGALVGIGPAASASGSATYVTIGQISDAKFSGASATEIKFTTLDGGLAVQKLRGSIDYGTCDITFVRAPGAGDAGQTAAAAAFSDPTGQAYKFQVQEYVAPGQTTAGDVGIFTGIVTKFSEIDDLSPDKVQEGMLTISLTSALTITAGS
jgi:hypothetical protein